MGFGIAELCILLEQAGRSMAPVPLLPTLVLGAAPIAEFGSEAQKAHWLPGVIAGKTVLTAALAESDSRDAEKPSTRANTSAGAESPLAACFVLMRPST
jgi:alkylation response protein AidB-like acyl-CoA dehydrogenase